MVIRIRRTGPHLLAQAAIRESFRMGAFSFFLLLIATFTLSSAALLLGWLLAERKPTASPAAAGGADPVSGNVNGRMPRDTF